MQHVLHKIFLFSGLGPSAEDESAKIFKRRMLKLTIFTILNPLGVFPIFTGHQTGDYFLNQFQPSDKNHFGTLILMLGPSQYISFEI